MYSDERPTIVCVDDESSVLEAVRTQLRDHLGSQYDIETAISGPEALELVDELIEDGVPVPLIISDEIMPEMRGHVLLKKLQEHLPDARKILMTGQAGVDAVVSAVNEADLFHYIAKPWERLDLVLTVDRALESYAAMLERRRRLETFHRFVPSQFLSLLGLDDPIDVRADLSQDAELTVMFTDLRSFSGMSEKAAPAEVLTTLNLVFGAFVPVIQRHDGIIDKFIGDAVMALFNSPGAALDAAVALVRSVEGLDTPLGRVRVGVGLHHGRAILGTVGTADRLETTAIGDVVNIAARVEAMTRDLGSSVLCSETVAQAVSQPMRFLGKHRVKGRRGMVGFYEPMALYPEPLRAAMREHEALFTTAVSYIESRGVPPCVALDQYTEAVPADRVGHALANILARRSAR